MTNSDAIHAYADNHRNLSTWRQWPLRKHVAHHHNSSNRLCEMVTKNLFDYWRLWCLRPHYCCCRRWHIAWVAMMISFRFRNTWDFDWCFRCCCCCCCAWHLLPEHCSGCASDDPRNRFRTEFYYHTRRIDRQRKTCRIIETNRNYLPAPKLIRPKFCQLTYGCIVGTRNTPNGRRFVWLA